MTNLNWRPPGRLGGIGRLGGESYGNLPVGPDAFIAPQFKSGQAGTYDIDVKVVGVPLQEEIAPYLDPSFWNDALANAGMSNATVSQVKFVVSSNTNARSAGGWWDFGGNAPIIADYTYRLTVTFATGAEGGGLSGLGVAPAVIWWGIAALVVAANVLLYKLTGTDVIIEGIKWVGKALGAAGGAVVQGTVPILIPALGLGLLALFLFTKMGGRGSYKGFSIGGS